MMENQSVRYAVVSNDGGIIANIIEAVEGFVVEGATLVPDDGSARIGGVWDGAAFLPPTTLPTVPTRITRRQARLTLLEAGLLDQVEALMASPETPAAIRITYEDATEWWRDDPIIQAIGPALGLTSEQVDALFITAATK